MTRKWVVKVAAATNVIVSILRTNLCLICVTNSCGPMVFKHRTLVHEDIWREKQRWTETRMRNEMRCWDARSKMIISVSTWKSAKRLEMNGACHVRSKLSSFNRAIAHIVDFRWTRVGGCLRLGVWRERRTFYIPLFDRVNRRNEQPMTENIIFSSPYKQFQLSNVNIQQKKSTKIWKKGTGVP